LFDFLNEITRVDETIAAAAGQGDFPVANWVHSFSNFEDIIDVLRIQLRISTPLSTIALKINLRRELLENLVLLTQKIDGKVDTTYSWAAFARRHLQGDLNARSQMPGRYLRWMLMSLAVMSKGEHMSTRFIDQALQSGNFLEFRRDSGEYISGWLNERLFQLRNRIARLHSHTDSFLNQIIQFIANYKELANTEGDVLIPNRELLIPFFLVDTEQDIVRLSIAILHAIDGNESLLPLIKLNPVTPILVEAERIQAATPTLSEIEMWVKAQNGE
jgi:hypothetical protein